MSKLANQWIELFRSGACEGKPTFTDADLDQIVANYNPSHHEAPATIGHIEDTGPAWGWFHELKRSGNLLLGKMRQVQPAFEEMVSSGLFKKRSVGLVKGDKGWSLHHVAFLGAKPPAIKGLADCSFGSEVAGLTKVEFEEDLMAGENTNLMDTLNAWWNERFPKSGPTTLTGTATFSEADVKRIAAEAASAAVAPVQAALDAQKAEFSERDKKLATAETVARAEAAIAKLRNSGRWVPAFDKMGLPIVFAALASYVALVEFGEGEAKKKVTPLDAMVAFMEGLKAIVPTAPVYTGQGPGTASKPGNINETRNFAADPNSIQLDSLVQARAKDKKLSYAEALSQVTGEHPELTIPGGAAAGAV